VTEAAIPAREVTRISAYALCVEDQRILQSRKRLAFDG
jgi:hypothetical protein